MSSIEIILNYQLLSDWCFYVQVSHIGTFEENMKYVIVFVFFCSFQGEKLFPKAHGVAIKIGCIYPII